MLVYHIPSFFIRLGYGLYPFVPSAIPFEPDKYTLLKKIVSGLLYESVPSVQDIPGIE